MGAQKRGFRQVGAGVGGLQMGQDCSALLLAVWGGWVSNKRVGVEGKGRGGARMRVLGNLACPPPFLLCSPCQAQDGKHAGCKRRADMHAGQETALAGAGIGQECRGSILCWLLTQCY